MAGDFDLNPADYAADAVYREPRCICGTYEYGSGAEVPDMDPRCPKHFPRQRGVPPYTPTTPDPARLTLGEP